MRKIIAEIGRTLGKAVLAGLGVELARLASQHLRKRLDPTGDATGDTTAPPANAAADTNAAEEPADLKAENAKLKAELQKLKTELADRSS